MPGNNGHVFVVDDDASFLTAISRLIRVGGFQVHGVGRLSDLYARLPFPQGSCVLTDIFLNHESGLDVLGALRARGEPTPVIFMSATDDPNTLLAANRAGSVPCLRKPFEAETVFRALQTALGAGEGTSQNSSEQERKTQ